MQRWRIETLEFRLIQPREHANSPAQIGEPSFTPMTGSEKPADATHEPRISALTPYIVQTEFLQTELIASLLNYACANASLFRAARVGGGNGGTVNRAIRNSSTLSDLGVYGPAIKDKLRPLAAEVAKELRLQPFELERMEIELAAHGDGAFFGRHIDTATSAVNRDAKSIRVVSGVYYFHNLPKAFEGGALRLHQIMPSSEASPFVDVEPLHNSLVLFPSWMPHEVMPVRCRSGRFADSRFAINCWFHRAR